MLDDLTPLHHAFFPACTARVAKRFEGYWTMQLLTAGSVHLAYDGRAQVLDRPAVWTCYPGPWITFHAAKPNGVWDHRYVAFLGPRVAQWQAEGLWFEGYQTLHEDRVEPITGAFDRVLTHASRTDRLGRLRTASLLETLLIDLADARRADTDPRPNWLARIMHRLADMQGPEPDYDQLARSAGMSLSNFRRRFKQAIGTPPHDYRLRCRIARARTLLSDTDQPIKQVADALGYNDVFYFSRQFTKAAGLPPAAYRRSRQG